MSDYIIKGETLTGIADAVREMRQKKGTMTPAQIKSTIQDTKLGFNVNFCLTNHLNPTTGEWVRPQGWPDLDTITIGDDFDGLYLTYDLTKTPGYGWIGLYVITVSSGGVFSIDRGHLSNGEFIVDETNSVNTGSYFRQTLDPTNGDYQLWRVTANKSIKEISFCTNTSGNSSDNFQNGYQPCVERVGRLDYAIFRGSSFGTSSTNLTNVTVWLERDAVKCKCLNSSGSLGSLWNGAYSLQSLEEIEDWPVENWKGITSLGSVFSNCFSLKKLNLSKWKTSGWNITNLTSTFNNMYSLEELDISTWDTSNWHVTTFNSTFNCCYSLKKLDLSNWDVSSWAVTKINQTWYCCYNLVYLDVSDWDVSGWAVTTLENTWSNCTSLYELDLSDWDVSNWKVTTLSTTWNNCYNLQKLDIGGWDVSGWSVTTMTQTFGYCYNLEELNIEDWDVSGWSVTTFYGTFYYCYSLKKLDLSKWDVSNWAVTTMAYTFYMCQSLEELDISNWDVSGWPVITISYCFNSCRSLKELDLSDWDISNWTMTASDAWNYWIRDAYSLEKLKLPSNWLKGGNGTNIWRDSFFNLTDFNGMPATVNHSYSNTLKLTPQSVINILNALPSVTGTKTITLGQNNKLKVTASDIAVATQKGWTVA